SYYIEALTTALADQARELIAEIDRLGGAVAAVESGWVQDQIEQAAFAHHQRVQTGDEVIVGVNRYTVGGCEPAAMPPRWSRRCPRWPRPLPARTICCRPCARRCGPRPRSAKCARCCGR